MSNINLKKEKAFSAISEILLSIETEGMDGTEKTTHILDMVEQLLARAIAGSSLTIENINEICEDSFYNIKKMSKRFLQEEMNEKTHQLN